METPIRVYQYPAKWAQLIVIDTIAAVLTTAFCFYFEQGIYALPATLFSGFFAAIAGMASFQVHRKRRVKIKLYADRIAWTGWLGNRREASLSTLGKAVEFPSILADARRRAHFTTSGFVSFSEELEGFGDLARRLEGAHLGWAARALPPSRLAWNGPDVFHYGGKLRTYAGFKLVGAVFFLMVMLPMTHLLESLLPLTAALALLGAAILDLRQSRYARIERSGDKLVQYDRWNKVVASIHLSSLHYVVTHEASGEIEGRIEGDDGMIKFGKNLEGSLELITIAYEIIADRHRMAIRTSRSEQAALVAGHHL